MPLGADMRFVDDADSALDASARLGSIRFLDGRKDEAAGVAPDGLSLFVCPAFRLGAGAERTRMTGAFVRLFASLVKPAPVTQE